MLAQLRKNASSFFVKFLLGTIVVVVIFFFGSKTLQNNSSEDHIVAKVNGFEISDRMVNGYLKLQKESNPMLENLPDEFLEQFRQKITDSLIEQQIVEKKAKELGIRVSDEELVDTVEKTPALLSKDGKFNYDSYANNFRPAYFNRYAIDYEDLVRSSLLNQKFMSLFTNSVVVSEDMVKKMFEAQNTKFKFEKIVINVNKLEEGYAPNPALVDEKLKARKADMSSLDQKIDDEQLIKQIESEITAEEKQKRTKELAESLWPTYIKGGLSEKVIKDNGLMKSETPPTAINDASNLIDRESDSTAISELLALSKPNPYPKNPIQENGHYYFFKFVDKTEPKWDDFDKSKDQNKKEIQDKLAQSLYEKWYEGELAKASIKKYQN